MNELIYLLFILFFGVSSISIQNNLDNMKLYILIGQENFLFNLVENPLTKELISILPMKIKLVNEDTSSKTMSFKIKIGTTDLISGEKSQIRANKGDLILFKGQELILINEERVISNENGDYIKLGNTKESESLFNALTKNKRILLWNTLNYENHKEKVKPYGYYTSIMNYLSWKIFTFFCFLLI